MNTHHVSSIVAINNPSRVNQNTWFKDAADYGKLASQVYHGWDVSLGVPIGTILKDTDAGLKAREEARIWTLDFVRKNNVALKVDDGQFIVIPALVEQAWEKMYCKDTKKGVQVIVPEFEQVLAFRRGAVLPAINAVRIQREEPLLLDLPIVIQELDDIGKIDANLTENLKKLAGAKGLSPADELHGAYLRFCLGAKEGDFMRIGFSRYSAQKMYALFCINARLRKAELVDKFISGELNWSAVDKNAICKPDFRDKAGIDDVMPVMQAKKEGNLPKILSRDKIQALHDQTPVDLIRTVCDCILKKDTGALSQYTAKAKEINTAVHSIMHPGV